MSEIFAPCPGNRENHVSRAHFVGTMIQEYRRSKARHPADGATLYDMEKILVGGANYIASACVLRPKTGVPPGVFGQF